MNSVTVTELARWLNDDKREPPQLLDVREPWETQLCRIDGSLLVPMRSLPGELDQLDTRRPLVCICHHGHRSAHVTRYLMQQGFAAVYNLTGGVDAWAREVEPSMPVY